LHVTLTKSAEAD